MDRPQRGGAAVTWESDSFSSGRDRMSRQKLTHDAENLEKTISTPDRADIARIL